MELSQVLKGLPVIGAKGDLSGDITHICYDSRRCSSGSLFVAVEGLLYDGHDFAGEALERGARCVVHEKDLYLRRGVTTVREPTAEGRSAPWRRISMAGHRNVSW